MAHSFLPSRMYTHEEWTLDKKTKCATAEKEREAAETVQNEADRLIDETDKNTLKTNKDVQKKFDQRLNDVKYWKKEIDKKLDDMTNETNELDKYFQRLTRALEATHEHLHFSQQCLKKRMEREGIDLVSDDAHKELTKEINTILGIQALFTKCAGQAKEQIRLNRKAIYDLKKESTDKLKAQNIDEYCESLRVDQELSRIHAPNSEKKKAFSFEDWQKVSINQINAVDKQIHSSKELRAILNGVLQQSATDQQKQLDSTNRAFKTRIEETRNAKGELEEHLALVLKEISHIEDTIVDLEKSIEDKYGYKQLATIRTNLRINRPNIENCKDNVSFRLNTQLMELQQSEEALAQQYERAIASLKGLRRKQIELEEVRIKTDTLFIDEVQCMGLRNSIKVTAF